jgi:uncharacterized protein YuzE
MEEFKYNLKYDILDTLIDNDITGNYDQESDILQILFDKNAKTRIVHYLPDDEHCAILFDIDNNNQVVGLHIENFSSFVKGQGDL